MKQLIPTIIPTYVIHREDRSKRKGYFEPLVSIKAPLREDMTDNQLRQWLMYATRGLSKLKRLRDGDHIFVVRTQAKGEKRGFHKILQGRVIYAGIFFFDRCKSGNSHKAARAIPSMPMSRQPRYQKDPVTNMFTENPPGTKHPFNTSYIKRKSFF